MTELKFKPKKEQKPSAILLKDLYEIVNDKKASHEERKQALDQINQQLGESKPSEPEPKPSEQKPIEPTEKKICQGCQCEFTPKKPEQRFCSIPCYQNFIKRNPKPKPQIIPKPKEPHYCRRCKTEVSYFSYLCEKCQKLIQILRDSKVILDLRRGNYLVYFENVGFWISQPKALAEHNEKLGKDVYKGKIESWLSDDLKMRLKRKC